MFAKRRACDDAVVAGYAAAGDADAAGNSDNAADAVVAGYNAADYYAVADAAADAASNDDNDAAGNDDATGNDDAGNDDDNDNDDAASNDDNDAAGNDDNDAAGNDDNDADGNDDNVAGNDDNAADAADNDATGADDNDAAGDDNNAAGLLEPGTIFLDTGARTGWERLAAEAAGGSAAAVATAEQLSVWLVSAAFVARWIARLPPGRPRLRELCRLLATVSQKFARKRAVVAALWARASGAGDAAEIAAAEALVGRPSCRDLRKLFAASPSAELAAVAFAAAAAAGDSNFAAQLLAEWPSLPVKQVFVRHARALYPLLVGRYPADLLASWLREAVAAAPTAALLLDIDAVAPSLLTPAVMAAALRAVCCARQLLVGQMLVERLAGAAGRTVTAAAARAIARALAGGGVATAATRLSSEFAPDLSAAARWAAARYVRHAGFRTELAANAIVRGDSATVAEIFADTFAELAAATTAAEAAEVSVGVGVGADCDGPLYRAFCRIRAVSKNSQRAVAVFLAARGAAAETDTSASTPAGAAAVAREHAAITAAAEAAFLSGGDLYVSKYLAGRGAPLSRFVAHGLVLTCALDQNGLRAPARLAEFAQWLVANNVEPATASPELRRAGPAGAAGSTAAIAAGPAVAAAVATAAAIANAEALGALAAALTPFQLTPAIREQFCACPAPTAVALLRRAEIWDLLVGRGLAPAATADFCSAMLEQPAGAALLAARGLLTPAILAADGGRLLAAAYESGANFVDKLLGARAPTKRAANRELFSGVAALARAAGDTATEGRLAAAGVP